MQHALTSRFGGTAANPGYDFGRILAGAGAIALHVVVLLLLLVPTQVPTLAPEPVQLPDVQWIQREPPPLVPIPVPVEQPRVVEPAPAVTPPVAIAPAQVPVPVVAAQPGDTPVPPVIPTASASAVEVPAVTSVMTGAALRYAVAPPPTYPIRALRSGREGTVLLEVLVDIDGRPLEVTIARSSGHRDLDRAAMKHVLAHWKFQPALQHGRPVQAIGRVPIGFQLR